MAWHGSRGIPPFSATSAGRFRPVATWPTWGFVNASGRLASERMHVRCASPTRRLMAYMSPAQACPERVMPANRRTSFSKTRVIEVPTGKKSQRNAAGGEQLSFFPVPADPATRAGPRVVRASDECPRCSGCRKDSPLVPGVLEGPLQYLQVRQDAEDRCGWGIGNGRTGWHRWAHPLLAPSGFPPGGKAQGAASAASAGK
jgi:hypothetical protein